MMQKIRIPMLLVCLALLTVFLSGKVSSAMPSNQASVVAYKTPEEAITAYMQGVAQADFKKVLQACAIDEVSTNFKFDLSIDRLRAFVPFQSMAPADYPPYIELNKAQAASQIAAQVKLLVYSLLSTEKVGDGKVILMDLARAQDFVKAVDPKGLAKLALKKIGHPNKPMMNTQRYIDNAAKLARVYGADESTERVALFSFDGNYYYVGFMLFRYGENWKINTQTSPMGNTSSLGDPVKTTVEDFEKLINAN